MSVFWPELPGILVSSFDVVVANIPQNFLQVNLGRRRKSRYSAMFSVFSVWVDGAWQSYHRLFGDVHQVFDIIVLVLLKGREQHVQDLLFVGSRSLALLLLLLLILQLQKRKK